MSTPGPARSPTSIALALLFTLSMVALGYLTVGSGLAVLFALGFFPGFLLWLVRPMNTSFQTIKAPYIVGLIAYVIHRTEEELSDFVPAVAGLWGDEAVPVTHPWSITIAVLSLAWFLSPLLMKRGIAFGHYGAWTLFTAFGVLELAHFVFPLFTPGPYGYFPGMYTAPLIIVAGWWGLLRMWRGERNGREAS